MYTGMSALVCSLIWTYLQSSNKRHSVCERTWKHTHTHAAPVTEEEGDAPFPCITEQDCVSLQNWSAFCTYMLYIHFRSACVLRGIAMATASHTFSSSFLTDRGAQCTHPHRQALRRLCEGGSVIRRRPLIHAERRAKSKWPLTRVEPGGLIAFTFFSLDIENLRNVYRTHSYC